MKARRVALAGIYRIVGPSGIYIGQSWDIHKRWMRHRSDCNRGVNGSKHLQRAWDKYGADAFVFEVVELLPDATQTLLNAREQHYVDALAPRYNVRKVAESNSGIAYSLESRQRISAVVRESWRDPGIRQRRHSASVASNPRRSLSLRGHRVSERSRQLTAERNRTREWTAEQREHMRRIKTGLTQSPETIARRMAKLAGRQDTPETRRKKSLAKMGHEVSAETRRKMSETKKATPLSEAQRAWYVSKRGVPLSEAYREKVSASLTRFSQSPEGRALRREAARARWESKALPMETVRAIRERHAAGMSQAGLARDYGVSKSQIHRIVRGLSRPEVTTDEVCDGEPVPGQ